MTADPDELLIFKLRGKQTDKAVQPAAKPEKKMEQVRVEQPTEVITEPTVEEVRKHAGFFSRITKRAVSKEEEEGEREQVRVEQPTEVITEPTVEEVRKHAGFFSRITKRAVSKEEEEGEHREEHERVIEAIMVQQEGALEQEPKEKQPAAVPRKGERSEKESMKAAKGLSCVNHPWRSAYAICDHCDRPFCYADLIEYGKKFYCLEDIDSVSSKRTIPINVFANTSGFLFIANALILTYFAYPEMDFMVNYARNNGISAILANLTFSYLLSLFNLAMVLLGLIVGLLIILKSEKGIYLGGIIGVAMLMGMTFEYLSSNYILYWLAISVIALVNLGFLAFSRMSATKIAPTEIKPVDIQWPGVEAF